MTQFCTWCDRLRPQQSFCLVSASLARSVHLVMDWSHPSCWASARTFQFGESEIAYKWPSFFLLGATGSAPNSVFACGWHLLARSVHPVMDWSHLMSYPNARTLHFRESGITHEWPRFFLYKVALPPTGATPRLRGGKRAFVFEICGFFNLRRTLAPNVSIPPRRRPIAPSSAFVHVHALPRPFQALRSWRLKVVTERLWIRRARVPETGDRGPAHKS